MSASRDVCHVSGGGHELSIRMRCVARLMPRRAATLECLDDDHAPAAARAGIRGWLGLAVIRTAGVVGLPGRLWNVEQLTGSGDVLGPAAIGEQAVMADAVEPAGQHVDQEAADELVDGECHHLAPSLLLRRDSPSI